MFWKRTLPVALCFLTGIVFLCQFYIPHQASQDMLKNANEWLIVIGIFALLLGLTSVISSHFDKIRNQRPGWGYSIFVFIGLIVGMVTGVVSKGEMFAPDGTLRSFGWMYKNMLSVLQGTMFAILGFYVASAAFRSFRFKSVASFLLIVAAVIVLFGKVALGGWIWSGLFGWYPEVSIGDIVEWILNGPNMSARRAILLGITFGWIAMSLKVIFGVERSYLGGGKE